MDTTQGAGRSSAKGEVWRIDPAMLDMFWPQVKLLLETYPGDTMQYTEVENIYNLLKAETLDLWLGFKNKEIKLGALTIFCGSKRKYLEIIWVGGTEVKLFLEESFDKFEKWAALQGADQIITGGRPGLQRLLRSQGFSLHRIELSKPLRYVHAEGGLIVWRQ